MDLITIIEKIISWKKTSIFRKILLIALMVSIQLFITFMIYSSGGTKTAFAYFVLLIVILGGCFFGPIGGAFLGITGGFFLGPFMPADATLMVMQETFDWGFRFIFYVVVGFFSGKGIRYLLDIIENLSSATLYQPITNLPNKKYFEKMDMKWDYHDRVAVIKFEEYYKMIESYGEDYANDFIKKISSIFVEIFNDDRRIADRPNVFHLDEDKLAVVFSELETKDNFKNVFKRIYRSIKSKELNHFPGVFIGISECNESNTKIIQNAETARRSARKDLKLYKIYSPKLSEKSNENFDLSMEIPRALNERQFFLCYHPKINLRSGEVEGIEALIRWNHAERGFIAPDNFIPHIEKTSMINKVTEWVLKTSFSEIKNMESENIDVNVSVNIPLKILENPIIVRYLKSYKKKQLPLQKLELEILERDNVEDFEITASAVKTLKKMGISFSLDDYGTGYSTLSYMQNLPFDKIKIDRMFIKDIETNGNTREIVRSTIGIVHILGMEVVAEGVETKETVEILKNMGCDYAQGYYYTKPLAYREFIDWHKKYKASEV
ncbi:GGDEF domain-containing phosphodiesterase [Ilyobacter polytropus]|uniref:Diguanylate cyclase/phosphodiesterase n=1 Tax=Ilyobacter polytropus (strain ATCC 51220 / DSM 2926 / LMG 16218 / CuHBu1) TaxID=572544 RepID=E3HDV6_ILYPC|nr:GGDEF domain-containing phosphodiesterase [Ilyobacter polytropus]ADO84568.1 diguanylate cyclase/phosphodiesterase [Ilyobacter polytropus DSM 2926]